MRESSGRHLKLGGVDLLGLRCDRNPSLPCSHTPLSTTLVILFSFPTLLSPVLFWTIHNSHCPFLSFEAAASFGIELPAAFPPAVSTPATQLQVPNSRFSPVSFSSSNLEASFLDIYQESIVIHERIHAFDQPGVRIESLSLADRRHKTQENRRRQILCGQEGLQARTLLFVE